MRPDISEETLAAWEARFLEDAEDFKDDIEEVREIFYAGFWIKEETKCSDADYPVIAVDFSLEGIKSDDPWDAARLVVQRYRDGYFKAGTRFEREFAAAISGMAESIRNNDEFDA